MKKILSNKTVQLIVLLALSINFLSFTNEKKITECTGVIHVRNESSTRSIIGLTLIENASYHLSVNIPPGGTYDPNFGVNIGGTATLQITFSSSTSAGTIAVNKGDYDGIPVTCSNFSGTVGSVTWLAGCVHYYVSAIDFGSFCH